MRRSCREPPSARTRAAFPALLSAVAIVLAAGGAPAQETGWTGRLFVQARSVQDSEAWLVLRQQVARGFDGGRRLGLGLVQTRRFGDWDASLEASGTLRPGAGTYLSLEGRVTPEADVLENARAGARVSLPLGEVVPSLGYRAQVFGDGTVHSVSPRLVWYRGPWLFSGELRIIRSAVETVNLAAIARVTRSITDAWSVRLGLARGEEDFLVGRPPGQTLRTLTTRSVFAGVEHDLPGAWSARLDVTGIDTDQRLDRLGGSVALSRSF